MAVSRTGARVSTHKASTSSKARPQKQSAIKHHKTNSGRWGSNSDKFDAGQGGKKPPGAR